MAALLTSKKARAAVDASGGTTRVAKAVGQNVSTVRRWKQFGTEGTSAILLRLLASGKITIQDVEQAHD